MLSKESLAKIASLLKLKESELSEAISATEEKNLDIPEITTLTPEEEKTLRDNEYKNGKVKGVEIAVKEAKEKHGLDFQGKTIDGLIEHAAKKALDDAKIEVPEKVKELEGKVQTLTNTINEYEGKISESEKAAQRAKIDRELFKDVPNNNLGTDDFIEFARLKGYDFQLQEGKLVALKDGEVIKDKLANPKPVKDVLTEFATERKLVVVEQPDPRRGRGGKDGEPAPTFTKLSELKAHFQSQGKSVQGQEFMAKVSELRKAMGEDFKLSE